MTTIKIIFQGTYFNFSKINRNYYTYSLNYQEGFTEPLWQGFTEPKRSAEHSLRTSRTDRNKVTFLDEFLFKPLNPLGWNLLTFKNFKKCAFASGTSTYFCQWRPIILGHRPSRAKLKQMSLMGLSHGQTVAALIGSSQKSSQRQTLTCSCIP